MDTTNAATLLTAEGTVDFAALEPDYPDNVFINAARHLSNPEINDIFAFLQGKRVANDWERDFLASVFEQSTRRRLSEKQMRILKRIAKRAGWRPDADSPPDRGAL